MNMVVGFLAYWYKSKTYLLDRLLPTLDQYAQAITNNSKKSYPDFKPLLAEDIKISGLPGKELSYTMSSDQSNYDNLLALAIKNNKAYTIIYSVFPVRYVLQISKTLILR
jgi:hypothetical protein